MTCPRTYRYEMTELRFKSKFFSIQNPNYLPNSKVILLKNKITSSNVFWDRDSK